MNHHWGFTSIHQSLSYFFRSLEGMLNDKIEQRGISVHIRKTDTLLLRTKDNLEIQGSKGIRKWPINLSLSPMMLHKMTPSDIDYN